MVNKSSLEQGGEGEGAGGAVTMVIKHGFSTDSGKQESRGEKT